MSGEYIVKHKLIALNYIKLITLTIEAGYYLISFQ